MKTLLSLPLSGALAAALERGLVRAPLRVAAVDAVGRGALWLAVTTGAILTLTQIARITGLA